MDGATKKRESGFEVTADYIEQLVDDMVCESMSSHNGLIADLLNCALGEIDYRELAEHYEEELEDV
jgi:hypothetical protein